MTKRKIKPIWFLIMGIAILIIPTAIYLAFLIPRMKDEYIILMASGGVIGGAGMFGTDMIPEATKYGSLYKTASRSFTLMTVIALVQKFIGQIIGLAIVFAVCYIIFLIFRELWRNGKRAKENAELAEEITRGITQNTK